MNKLIMLILTVLFFLFGSNGGSDEGGPTVTNLCDPNDDLVLQGLYEITFNPFVNDDLVVDGQLLVTEDCKFITMVNENQEELFAYRLNFGEFTLQLVDDLVLWDVSRRPYTDVNDNGVLLRDLELRTNEPLVLTDQGSFVFNADAINVDVINEIGEFLTLLKLPQETINPDDIDISTDLIPAPLFNAVFANVSFTAPLVRSVNTQLVYNAPLNGCTFRNKFTDRVETGVYNIGGVLLGGGGGGGEFANFGRNNGCLYFIAAVETNDGLMASAFAMREVEVNE